MSRVSTKNRCLALAQKIACDLDVDQRHRTITIHLPAGRQIQGNAGLNCRVNNFQSMAETWQATLDDLRELSDEGMEPMEVVS